MNLHFCIYLMQPCYRHICVLLKSVSWGRCPFFHRQMFLCQLLFYNVDFQTICQITAIVRMNSLASYSFHFAAVFNILRFQTCLGKFDSLFRTGRFCFWPLYCLLHKYADSKFGVQVPFCSSTLLAILLYFLLDRLHCSFKFHLFQQLTSQNFYIQCLSTGCLCTLIVIK